MTAVQTKKTLLDPKEGLLIDTVQNSEGKYNVYHYGFVKGKEYIKFITDFVFDTELSAIEYAKNIVSYQKGKFTWSSL